MSNDINTVSASSITDVAKVKHIDRGSLNHSHDADDAMKVFEDLNGEAIELDSDTNRRLLQTTLSYASIMGFKNDLNLHGNQYQWLGSLFYFGYLAWEYPTNLLLQRLPLSKYTAACIMIWGLILTCFATVHNYSGAIAVRFFLGMFEAAVTPAFALLTSQVRPMFEICLVDSNRQVQYLWYTRYEHFSHVNIWFSFNGFGQIFGGLVAYGIAVGTEKHGSAIASWKIIFLLTGLLTIVLGLLFLWEVPDNQLNARWLKKEDRILAIVRVRVNQQGIGNKHFKLYQVKEAFLDPMTWAFFFYALLSDIPNGGITNFFSQLITSFRYTQQQSLLYGTPAGAVQVISLFLSGYIGHVTGQRILSSIGGLIVAIVGMVLIIVLPLSNGVGRLIGFYMTLANTPPFVALLSLISSNVAGYTKKTTVAALFLIGYCVGNIIGPQVFRPKDALHYVPAEITIVICWGVCLLLMIGVWWWYGKKNRGKAMIRARPDYVRLENQEWLDLTDWENPEFVYSV